MQENAHPLADCLDHYSRTWPEWKEEWSAAKTYDHKKILICRGFYMEATDGESVERLLLYFRLADGHRTGKGLGERDHWGLGHPYPTQSYPKKSMRDLTELELKKALAGQAYAELSYHFFRSREDNFHYSPTYRYPWLKWLKYQAVLETIVYFFRLEGTVLPNYYFDQREDNRKHDHVGNALEAICGARWGAGLGASQQEWSECQLESYGTKFLEILFGLRRLEILVHPLSHKFGYGRDIFRPDLIKLEPSEVAKLRELVLKHATMPTDEKRHSFGGGQRVWRPAVSIQEALTRPSDITHLYLLVCARQNLDWRP